MPDRAFYTVARAVTFHRIDRVVIGGPGLKTIHAHAEYRIGMITIEPDVGFRNRVRVKAEIKTSSGHATQSIPLAGAMMKQVSPSMQIEMLDDRECRELKRLAESPERFRQPNSAEATRAYLELYTSPEAQPMNAYYKMPVNGYHEGESGVDAAQTKKATRPFLVWKDRGGRSVYRQQ